MPRASRWLFWQWYSEVWALCLGRYMEGLAPWVLRAELVSTHCSELFHVCALWPWGSSSPYQRWVHLHVQISTLHHTTLPWTAVTTCFVALLSLRTWKLKCLLLPVQLDCVQRGAWLSAWLGHSLATPSIHPCAVCESHEHLAAVKLHLQQPWVNLGASLQWNIKDWQGYHRNWLVRRSPSFWGLL